MERPIIEELEIERTPAPMVLVLGETGAGKSHFINKLAGRKVVKESARASSCTKKPELVEVSIGEQSFLMIDTPGFNDTDKETTRSDGRTLGEIARTLTLQTQMGVKLRGILILYDISAPRMTGDKRRQLEMIKTVCGKNNYSNVLLVTTHWPKDYLEQIEQGCALREADLRSDFWKDMVKGGSKMVRFDNDEDSARAIVGPLAEKPDITLALQLEMASGRKLSATSAGTYVLNTRREDEEILKSLQAKAKKLAKDPNNPELVQEIEELQASIQAQKAAEAKLESDIVGTIRKEIRDLDQEARKRGRKPTVANIVSWLIGLSELTVQIVQTVFTATSSSPITRKPMLGIAPERLQPEMEYVLVHRLDSPETPLQLPESYSAGGSDSDSSIEEREGCPPALQDEHPLAPTPTREYLHISSEPSDLEAGVSDEPTPNNAAETEETPARYALINLAVLLNVVIIVTPSLLFIAVPSWFIVTGQRHRMENSFYHVYWSCVGLVNGAYLGMVCDRIWQGAGVRDALAKSQKWTAIFLLWLVGAGFSFRILYYICLGIGFVVRAIWGIFSELVIAIWGG